MPPKSRSRARNISSRLERDTKTDDEISDDEEESNIHNIATDEVTAIDDEDEDDFESEESSDEDNDNVADDDYFPTKAGKRKAKASEKRQQQSIKKRKKASYAPRKTTVVTHESREDQEQYLEMVKEFEPSELFSILSTSDDISIDELLRELLESYSEERDTVIQKIINLLLDCCGAMIHVEDHDVHSNESSNDTISEIQLSFQNQKIHEFNLLLSKNNKKKSNYKPLYQNFVEFMSKFLDVANDLQLLYSENDEDGSDHDENDETKMNMGPLVLDLLTWLSSFSVCKTRCFRYVSTLTLYLFQDYLSKHAVNLEKNYLAKLTKQLSMENKKKRPNGKTVEKLEENIEEIQNNKIIIDNIIDNIVKLCFVHRFKDVDELIRSDSMLHLATWIENNPEYFMKVTFLKYFGWLLSDSSAIVRSQILKTLPQIIKSSHHSSMVDNPAIRQFFERFKERILEIATKDVDMEVVIQAVNVLIEASTLDYLEDSEVLTISSLIFNSEEIKVSSYSKNSRLMASVAKLLARASTEKYKEFVSNADLDEDISKVKTSSIVKIGIIIRILNSSLLYYLENNDAQDISNSKKSQVLYQAAEFLYPYFGTQINNICELLTDDNEFQEVYDKIVNASRQNDEDISMDDDDSSGPKIDASPLLPNNNENVVFYVTILSGLCNGGMNMKGQSKYTIAESVLPHLEDLLKNLSTNSNTILLQILNIFNLFEFDDWMYTGYEKDIKNINSIILKGFNGTLLPSTDLNDDTYKTFSQTIHHIKGFNLNEIDEVWMNQISMIKLQFAKYLSETESNKSDIDFIEVTNSIYSYYINRLVLLGKEYTIEFSSELLELFFRNFMNKLPMEMELNEMDNVEDINFKLPVILVTCELQKWNDLLKRSTEVSESNISGTSEKITSVATVNQSFTYFSSIIENHESVLLQMNNIQNDNKYCIYKIKWSLANVLIDILVALKCFELQLPENEINWRNTLKDIVSERYLNDEIVAILLDVFLYLEGVYAKDQGVQLDRDSDEDVTLNELPQEAGKHNSERDLLVYTVKMKGLMKLNLLNTKITRRIARNKESFGPLFESIIDDSIFEDDNIAQINSNKTLGNMRLPLDSSEPILTYDNSSVAHGTEENIDPIEDGTQSSRQINDLNVIPENSDELTNDAIENDTESTQARVQAGITNGAQFTSEI